MPAAARGRTVPLTGAVTTCCSAGGRSCDVLAGAVDGVLYHVTWSDQAGSDDA